MSELSRMTLRDKCAQLVFFEFRFAAPRPKRNASSCGTIAAAAPTIFGSGVPTTSSSLSV